MIKYWALFYVVGAYTFVLWQRMLVAAIANFGPRFLGGGRWKYWRQTCIEDMWFHSGKTTMVGENEIPKMCVLVLPLLEAKLIDTLDNFLVLFQNLRF